MKYSFLALLLLFSTFNYAQTKDANIIISGKVTNELGFSLENVEVGIRLGSGDRTTSDGNYEIDVTNFLGMAIDISFSLEGYKDTTIKNYFVKKHDNTLDIKLSKPIKTRMITGIVLSEESEIPVPDAHILVSENTAFHSYSDSNGLFSIRIIDNDLTEYNRVEISISKRKYEYLQTIATFDKNNIYYLTRREKKSFNTNLEHNLCLGFQNQQSFIINSAMDTKVFKNLFLGIDLSLLQTFTKLNYQVLDGFPQMMRDTTITKFTLGIVGRYNIPLKLSFFQPSIVSYLSYRIQQILLKGDFILGQKVKIGPYLNYSLLTLKMPHYSFYNFGNSDVEMKKTQYRSLNGGLSLTIMFNIGQSH